MCFEKSNVIIFHTDQQRFDCVGCNGNSFIQTPNIDSIAEQGVKFTRHISSNPVCMPSRASLFTGMYPLGHNVRVNGVPLNRRKYLLSKNEKDSERLTQTLIAEPQTLADIFKRNGYRTAAFGKLHFTPHLAPVQYRFPESYAMWQEESNEIENWTGPYYGFDYVKFVLGHGEYPCFIGGHYSKWLKKHHREIYDKVRLQDNRKYPVLKQRDLYPSIVPSELHNTNWLAENVCDYLKQYSDNEKPFFVFVGFPDPHHPFTPSYDIVKEFENADVHQPIDPKGQAAKSSSVMSELIQNKAVNLSDDELMTVIRYTYAMIYQIDLAIGKILSCLKSQGLWDRTVIVFTSDHGDWLGDHKLLYKADIGCDSLLHTPLIMRFPRANIYEREINLPVSNCDVAPTLLNYCGIDVPFEMHGENISGILGTSDRAVFAFAIYEDLRLLNYTLYTSQYRFTYYPNIDYCELYDHWKDKDEIYNIADSHKSLCNEFINCLGTVALKYSSSAIGRIADW